MCDSFTAPIPELCTIRGSFTWKIRSESEGKIRGRSTCLEGFFRPGASAGDSRETDNAASVRLVEPSGHKLIMEFFFFGFVRTGGAQQAGSCVRIMPSNLFCIGRRDSGSRAEARPFVPPVRG